MKLLFDYFPIICFFIAYKLYGVYVATAVTMGACALQNIIYWLKNRRFEKLHLITLISVLILGSFTLIFHKAIFIQWKPSIIYWIFAAVLLSGQFISKKNLLARMLGDKIILPSKIWNQLNIAWSIFFIFLGFLNVYVIYHYSMNAWVNFKLFGTLGLTLVFTIAQAIYMSQHIQQTDHPEKEIIQ
ncbi:MAG: septation protein A [Gammaproteobacteria bacterium CG_4_10_14_0_8_um_filter_38_16]|nr:MAG: septation protein A [Gammaproteobacteria bacterium CG_4_10_14_0_8_um_filter_38_16]PJA03078.1 MAG: septation protein A [Gammaproteobacteria bacterium CG_4_10_14_0_2_um_filter_38_22]PJB10128.1 MAG: septation protein A [Gammaproteobacteria bacterium CG_4_9_14_3_um_filter_38_9]